MDQNSIADFPTNWGRWGATDQLGAVNLITAEARARGVAEARTGKTVSLARESAIASLNAGPASPVELPTAAVHTVMMFTGSPAPAMAEYLMMPSHHRLITHLDAMGHFIVDGQVYPGVPQAESSGPAGVTHGAADVYGNGILTRGILLDLAPGGRLPDGHPVTAADLTAAARHANVEPRPGDAIVVRGGWDHAADLHRGLPGMTAGAVRWMHEQGVSVYAGDIGDAMPPLADEVPGALHRLGLGRLAIPLIDGADAEALAGVCAELGRHTFMLVVAIPRILGTSGLPVNPLAVF
ncbi:cyclase family protein [Actinoplanes sp. NPDC049265]|uniref:cyclase family protein n=1 Tax=Actinoplanes sp. NPDC049265 TaxID=3363902 RepID=UPI003714F748